MLDISEKKKTQQLDFITLFPGFTDKINYSDNTSFSKNVV